MNLLRSVANYFISDDIEADSYIFYRYKLLLNASIFTSLFSLLYLGISVLIEFQFGVYFMIFNVAGFLMLPFLMKTRLSVIVLGNIYVFMGTLAVLVLIYYSGGIKSPIFPWLIAPPVLALLIVNRFYALIWTGIAITCLIYFTVNTFMFGNTFPVKYNTDWNLLFTFLCSFGIILIVVLIAMIFENNTITALKALEARKIELEISKDEILEKNEILTSQKEELQITSEQLVELHEKKDYLLEIIAHDLKSPLANIQALIGLIKRDNYPLESSERQVIDLIIDAAKKSQALIRKILSSENLENIVYNLNLEVCDVSIIIKQCIEDVRESAANKNIQIHFAAGEGLHFWAFVDKIYLNQVYENLLNNAIKFSLPGKHIYVSLNASDNTIRTEVRDEGPGIQKEEMGLLFKKYKKLSNKPTGGESSTGLGLSIVKHYAELLNGKVWCDSTPGKGSNFIVELPLHTLSN
jgi:signal transduction histidine kinase